MKFFIIVNIIRAKAPETPTLTLALSLKKGEDEGEGSLKFSKFLYLKIFRGG
ncbi:MAG: hypothetical protein ABIL70_06495 [candidate division WOR-3 bacterium]